MGLSSVWSSQRLSQWLSSVITALANFTAQYNIQCIAVALLVMSDSKCTSNDDFCRHGIQDSWVSSASSACIFVGAICGQLFFGFFGDIIGRNKALAITLIVATGSSFLSAVAPTGDATSVYGTIIFCRFLLGVGNGGIFPLSAVKASEDGSRGEVINSMSSSWAYFWQMPALSCPWLLAYIMSFSSPSALSVSSYWRLLLGFGAVLSGSVLGLQAIEWHLFTSTSASNEEIDRNGNEQGERRAREDSGSFSELSLTKWETAISSVRNAFNDPNIYRKLLATGGTYFLYCMVLFGVTLSAGSLVRSIRSEDDDVSSRTSIRHVSEYQLIASCLAIPGGLLAIALQPRLGLKRLQTLSFAFLTLLFLLLASLYRSIRGDETGALFGLYCLLNFALQAGVNVTVFSLPSATFGEDVRSTMNGIAAALGKAGATVGAFSFIPLVDSGVDGFAYVMGVACVLCALGAVISHLFIEGDLKDGHFEKPSIGSTLRSSLLQPSVGV